MDNKIIDEKKLKNTVNCICENNCKCIDNLLEKILKSTILSDGQDWKETIINCDCEGSDTIPCKQKWCFINEEDIIKYKRQFIPIGSNSHIQKNKNLLEIKPQINDLINKNWIHENGKYIMSLKAYKMQKYIEYIPSKEIKKYNIINDYCKKHNYYDIKLINIYWEKIKKKCNSCINYKNENILNSDNDLRHKGLCYNELFNVIKKCECDILKINSNICLFCNQNKDFDEIKKYLIKEFKNTIIPELHIKKTKKICDIHQNIYLYSIMSQHLKNCEYYDNINLDILHKEISKYYDDDILKKYNEYNLLKLKECNCSHKNKTYMYCPLCDIEIFLANKKLNDKFKFGKYKDSYIIKIIKEDYNYINWVYLNLNEYKKFLDKIIKF